MKRVAACCCEGFFVEVEGDPVAHLICHCRDCKRRTGSAFGVSAQFKRSQLVRTNGERATYRIGDQWGEQSCAEWGEQRRYFCRHCGSTLYWEINALPDTVVIAGGCFKEPLPEPEQVLYPEDAFPWARPSPS